MKDWKRGGFLLNCWWKGIYVSYFNKELIYEKARNRKKAGRGFRLIKTIKLSRGHFNMINLLFEENMIRKRYVKAWRF